MKNAEKLKTSMRFGHVYRRQDLEGISTAVDRDLKTLIDSDEVRKLAWGLYCRAQKDTSSRILPDERELVRAFLKTDDFLLMSSDRVYNHKRAGDFLLGGRRFEFRIIRAYPKVFSKEYLLVDSLNRIGKLSDDIQLDDLDRDELSTCLDRYGNPGAKRILRGMLRDATPSAGSGGASVVRDGMPLRIVAKDDEAADLGFWLGRSPAERVAAVEFLREQYYAMSDYKSLPRLAHAIRLRSRQA